MTRAGRRTGRSGLPTIAVLLALVLWPAAALAAGGAIAGTVSEAGSGDPIEGIEACAWSMNPDLEEEEALAGEFGCAKTGSSGEYTIGSLNAGSYVVVFTPPLSGTPNFVSQYYDDRSLTQEPTPVTVAEGVTTKGIDAQMEPGGELSGVVTVAAGGAPAEGAFVCALEPVGGGRVEGVACTLSGSGGAFAVAGVPAGTFELGADYVKDEEVGVGYFGGSLLSEATPVPLGAREVKTGLDIALTMKHVVHEEAPAGGGPSGGPAGSEGAAGAGGGTHTSGSGSGLSLTGRRIAVRRGGEAHVGVECSGSADCRGRLELRERQTYRRGGRTVSRMVVLGAAAYRLAAGHSEMLAIRLDAAGLRRLRAGRGRLPFQLAIIQSAPGPRAVSVKDVVLTEKAPTRSR